MKSEQSGVGARALVAVVDDDESIRESLPDLLRELGFEAIVFSSAEEFLASDRIPEVRCLILDVSLPGQSGPELQRLLSRQGRAIPTVFITGRAEASIPPGLILEFECLFKPFSDQALRSALDAALPDRK